MKPVIKVFKMKNVSAWSGVESDSTIRISFNMDDFTVSMETAYGPAPDCDRLLEVIMTDRNFRHMSEKYRQKGRKFPYKTSVYESFSGAKTFYIQTLKNFCGTIVPYEKRKEVIHETCFGKLENFSNIYVGDLVEVIFHQKSYLLWDSISERNWLYKTARRNVKFIPPITFERNEFSQKWDVHSF